MDAVVDRDDRSAGDERRQHVVRRVEERDAFTPERQRDPELLADRIVARGFRHGPEILAERAKRLAVVGPGEHDKLGLTIEPRQVPQQVADVRADAEIVQLPRVYADAHRDMILSRSGRSGRSGGSGRLGRALPTRPT